jgi:hypothetical protein
MEAMKTHEACEAIDSFALVYDIGLIGFVTSGVKILQVLEVSS